MASQSARMAVAPWRAYPPNAEVLKPDFLPRSTSAMTLMIQASDISHTTPAAIHHSISITSLLYSYYTNMTIAFQSPFPLFKLTCQGKGRQ
jgi:hypothetical protein